jgi:hypothetical protein
MRNAMKRRESTDPARPTHPPSRVAWWTLPLTREQWQARAAQEAERMNAVSSNQHAHRDKVRQ